MQLGIIEGFFGEPWSWEARHEALPFLASTGYGLYLYAPKADRHLRGRWSERHPPGMEADLLRLGSACRTVGVRFAIGLSPLALYDGWNASGRADLLRRVDELLHLGIDGLGLFFDDMRGDLPDLAVTQAAICAEVRRAHPQLPIWLCPTYYTDDPVLDRVFGQRPDRYLETLGEGLPEGVEVFWTGDRVCSTAYEADVLAAVRERLGRPLAIWDNYPVNDGPRMCKRLHLRDPGGRGPALADVVSTWCVNPMNQAATSRLPLAAIARHLRGEPVDMGVLAREILGEDLGDAVLAWTDRFQDLGLDALTDRDDALRAFRDLPGPAAEEIVHWLEGRSIVGPECLTDTDV
ncbi:MAG: beta-N-acetylglucosaminidase domain-containing protein [Alphaproteobacteria bacterium]|nr:beta-N-acetylglucosaminidase domain-containing protein [Alphaproteobacteria bacterium]MCB9692015.1 beta-N-acetylglucosaminidase domain-containing protein [Alphaproteobacteria bacterium]